MPFPHISQGCSDFFRCLPSQKKLPRGAPGIRGAHPHSVWAPGASLTCRHLGGEEQDGEPAQPHALRSALARAAGPCSAESALQPRASHSLAATARGPQSFAAFQCEVSPRGRSLQWGDFQISSPRGREEEFEPLM